MSNVRQDLRKLEIEKMVSEQKVLQGELSSLKKGAKVYKQQKNSNLYFLSSVDKEMAHSKSVLDSLIGEYKEAGQSDSQDIDSGET